MAFAVPNPVLRVVSPFDTISVHSGMFFPSREKSDKQKSRLISRLHPLQTRIITYGYNSMILMRMDKLSQRC